MECHALKQPFFSKIVHSRGKRQSTSIALTAMDMMTMAKNKRKNKTKSINAMGFHSYSYLFPSDIGHLSRRFLRLFLALTLLNVLVLAILFFVLQLADRRQMLGLTPKTKEK